jgi:hypothetical protein
MILVLVSGAHAQQQIDGKQLEQAIDQVVHQREFTWRSPHPSGPEPDGKWVGWYRSSVKMIQSGWNWLMKKLREWFSPPDQHGVGKDSPVTRRTMLALIVGNVALIAGCIVFFLLRRRRRTVFADPVVAAAPAVNLSDESLTADRLPEKEWLALAEEMLAKGDFRLALRATYLAGLNYLSARELVSLRRWKSGLDYRRELARRARTKPDLPESFAQGQAIFEKGWYGRHAVDREMAESLALLLNQMRNHAQ